MAEASINDKKLGLVEAPRKEEKTELPHLCFDFGVYVRNAQYFHIEKKV